MGVLATAVTELRLGGVGQQVEQVPLRQERRVLSYPSGMNVSRRVLTMLADTLRQHPNERATRWRKLTAGRQALLVVAYLRKGTTYSELACGFSIGTSTVYRYLREAIDALTEAGIDAVADTAYQSAGPTVAVLQRRRRLDSVPCAWPFPHPAPRPASPGDGWVVE